MLTQSAPAGPGNLLAALVILEEQLVCIVSNRLDAENNFDLDEDSTDIGLDSNLQAGDLLAALVILDEHRRLVHQRQPCVQARLDACTMHKGLVIEVLAVYGRQR